MSIKSFLKNIRKKTAGKKVNKKPTSSNGSLKNSSNSDSRSYLCNDWTNESDCNRGDTGGCGSSFTSSSDD